MKFRGDKKYKSRNTNRIPFMHHVVLFIFREVIFSYATSFLLSLPVSSHPEGFYVVSDIMFLNIFNIFIFFLVFSSLIGQRIFRYYVSIVALLNNGLINILALNKTLFLLDIHHAFIISGAVSISYFVEAMISIYLVYINRFQSWMAIFRKIGPSQKLRDAFFYRQILHALIPYEVFVTFEQLGCIIFPISECSLVLRFLSSTVIIFSFIQLILICVNFNEEDVFQRKVAIGASVLKQIVVGIQFGVIMYLLPLFNNVKFFVVIIYTINYMIVGFITLVVLIIDIILFNSGLKGYLKSNDEAQVCLA